MSYQVGVDVGGTFTTVAVVRAGRAEVVKIVPSRLPGVPRGFLRRVGDDTPVLVGARPVPAETLVAQLVHHVVAGLGTPGRLAVTHPVTWGPHRVAALRVALGEVTMLSTAAAVAYRAETPAAVHDLGGTTFTAAVVAGLAAVGQPLELDLGGADLDELVFNHVQTAMGDNLPTDPAELARLRQACTLAKETLSADTEVEIPVADTRVRLTRAEFEDMARPLLAETAAAFRLTIEESGVTPASVLLTGGAARLPLLTQAVSEELGRPVTATPPGAAAMGAALAAAGFAHRTGNPSRASAPVPPMPPTRLVSSLEPLPGRGSVDPTSVVEPVRPPVPIPAAPPTPKTKRPRTMIAVAAASLVAVGAVGAILLSAGQTPPDAGADTKPATVTETVPVTTTTTQAPPPVETPTRQAPQTPPTTRPKTTTTTKTTQTTTGETTTTTTPPTSTTTNTPQSRGTETSAGGDR